MAPNALPPSHSCTYASIVLLQSTKGVIKEAVFWIFSILMVYHIRECENFICYMKLPSNKPFARFYRPPMRELCKVGSGGQSTKSVNLDWNVLHLWTSSLECSLSVRQRISHSNSYVNIVVKVFRPCASKKPCTTEVFMWIYGSCVFILESTNFLLKATPKLQVFTKLSKGM